MWKSWAQLQLVVVSSSFGHPVNMSSLVCCFPMATRSLMLFMRGPHEADGRPHPWGSECAHPRQAGNSWFQAVRSVLRELCKAVLAAICSLTVYVVCKVFVLPPSCPRCYCMSSAVPLAVVRTGTPERNPCCGSSCFSPTSGLGP